MPIGITAVCAQLHVRRAMLLCARAPTRANAAPSAPFARNERAQSLATVVHRHLSGPGGVLASLFSRHLGSRLTEGRTNGHLWHQSVLEHEHVLTLLQRDGS